MKVQSYSYTAYGEQMGAVKFSGFTYNAEAFDAATGMLNLRARQYEAALGRFSQKDIVRGQATSPLSLNRYVYCDNSSLTFADPSGMLLEKVISTAKSIVQKVVNTTKKGIKTAAAYVEAAVHKKMIDDAQFFGEYSSKYFSLDAEKQGIIQDAVSKLQRINLSTASGRIEASQIFSNACSLLKGESSSHAAGTIQTPGPTPAPTPTPTPSPTPIPKNQPPLPQTTYPDWYSVMANGSMLSQELLQYLVPQYDQAAKKYNSLTGTDTFDLIGNGRTGVEQFIYTVYDNTLQPIGQMIAEDGETFLASGTARYIAYKNDGSLYNTANYFLYGIPDAVESIIEGYRLRGAALQQNQDASSFLNWLTSGLSGQFEIVVSTPMSDPDYWRATKNIVGTGTAAIMAYQGFTEWNISQNPHSTEWLMRYSEKMAGPPGKVSPGTFDEAFEHYETLIDDQVTMLTQQQLPDSVVSTFKDGYYRTVVTNEDIEVYRVFGGNADASGGLVIIWSFMARIAIYNRFLAFRMFTSQPIVMPFLE